ncbi:MAG: alpha/beta hydrolase fold domain-containing protein [Candidatus Hinthialibacter sp.]
MKQYRNGFMTLNHRLFVWMGLLVFAVYGVDIHGEENTQSIPPLPKGYANETLLKAAILLKQIELIDPKNVPIPDTVVEEVNIEYGKAGDKSLQLDLYRPKEFEKPAPGLIFIHGGAWKSGKRQDMKFYAVHFAQKGYVCATVSYRLMKEALFPAAVQDVKCAVRWMRANAGKYYIDPERIAVSGNSAGGHLAMMIGYSSDVPELEGEGGYAGVSSRVQAVINFYGPVDLTTDFAKKQDGVVNFLGATYEENPQQFVFASPLSHLTKDDPPTLIFHGTIDSTVPIGQADALEQKLQSLGIDYVYDKFVGWPHAMDLAKVVNDRCRYQMIQFLKKHLQ